jgi:hypothetical protein
MLTGKNRDTEKKFVSVPFHYKSHMNWLGIEPPASSRGGQLTSWAMALKCGFGSWQVESVGWAFVARKLQCNVTRRKEIT